MTSIASANTQGLRSFHRRRTAFSIFQGCRFDIILLEEMHWTSDIEMENRHDWGGEIFVNHGSHSARGVAILISSRLEYNVRQTRSDNEGRVLNILLDVEEQTVNIVNVYAPLTDTQRRIFFSDLEHFLSSDYVNIVGGDFNYIFDIHMDKFGGDLGARQSASGVLNTMNARYDLRDIWWKRHRGERNYTWTGGNPNSSFIPTRIDFFLASKAINQFVTSVEIKPYAHPDHDSIIVTVDFERVQRGPGYWHFNKELLSRALFQEEIKLF